ncbi:MAG: DDE-type integrase/transposase/recombinase [Bacteriovoracaceae bacterium]|nr:DDE-type integrase/transposase/recombinase [Bacteriovoracaceae bacterium]
MKARKLLEHRGKSKRKSLELPLALIATRPNMIYSWDITYLKSSVAGKFYYLYLFMDIYSRKIVGWKVHDCESMEYSSQLAEEIFLREGILKDQVVLHSDNGAAMKGATMLATLQRLGIVPSFSRPRVSDDNPYSESLFKTLKYCPQYPSNPFSSTDDASGWVDEFVFWYNEVQKNSETLSMQRLFIKVTSIAKTLSSYSGLHLFSDLISKFDLKASIPEKSRKRGFSSFQKLYSGVLGFVAGAECIDDFDCSQPVKFSRFKICYQHWP